MGNLVLCCGLLFAPHPDDLERDVRISPAERDERGVLVHRVESPFQLGVTKLRVLLPGRYGDALSEVLRYRLHQRHRVLFVSPTFSHLPWYADHPANLQLRQESYLLHVVLPAVESRYPVQSGPQGRLLVGFSKSASGAFSLLLRHPQVFGKAVAWDTPLLLDRPGRYGSGGIFATQENFDRYRVGKLLESSAVGLRDEPRLFVFGFGNFRADHRGLHQLLTKWQVAHEYRDGPPRRHDWHSGCLPEAVAWLVPAAQAP
jgi:hypothetical protein